MRTKPVVGMKVRLNNHGILTINGFSSWEEAEAAMEMTITEVSEDDLGDGAFWAISVSGPLNRYMLTNLDVDPI